MADPFPKTFHVRAEVRGIYSSLKEVDLLATLPLEVASLFLGDDKKGFKIKIQDNVFPALTCVGTSTYLKPRCISGNGMDSVYFTFEVDYVFKCVFLNTKILGSKKLLNQSQKWR